MEDAALLTLAADLARRAGAVILAVRARGFETTRKSDASPVTEADHAAEALIVQGLRAATPGIPVVAEEEHAAGAVAAEHHEYWLVDPLLGPKPRAWKRTTAGEHAIRARTPPPEGLHVLASRHSASDPRLQAFLQGRAVAGMVNMGSALKIVRVAEGAADLYPRFGRTMEWDTAAPHAVLEAAGGQVRAADGTPLLYGKPGWENPAFVCTGR